MLQGGQFFSLFEQDREQDRLEGQEGLALADGGDMFAGGGEDAIKDELITFAQGTPKGGEHGFRFVEILGNGDDGASHWV